MKNQILPTINGVFMYFNEVLSYCGIPFDKIKKIDGAINDDNSLIYLLNIHLLDSSEVLRISQKSEIVRFFNEWAQHTAVNEIHYEIESRYPKLSKNRISKWEKNE